MFDKNKKNHYSIRKLSVGAASVLIGISFLSAKNELVRADTVNNNETITIKSNEAISEKTNKEIAKQTTEGATKKATGKVAGSVAKTSETSAFAILPPEK